MKIFKIMVQHCSQKDSHTATECLLLAENDDEVYEWLNHCKLHGQWEDENSSGEMLRIYDDDYEVIGEETFREKMIRIKGDMNDENQDWSDAHYGLTFWGWELVFEDDTHAEALRLAGILEDSRVKGER